MASIFIQIPSYHDEELILTIENLILRSSKNNIINFGIHNGYYLEPIFDEKILKSVNKKNKISVHSSAFPENIGVGISRNIANSFYDGEDYYFQIDSHMRFIKNWDEIMIDNHRTMMEDYGFEKLILSNYPAHYSYHKMNDFQNEDNGLFFNTTGPGKRIVIDEFSEISTFFNLIPNYNVSLRKLKYYIGNTYLSGANVFTSGDYHLIKPNTQILHKYDEMLTGFRAYTHGFDVMPQRWEYCYHLYRSCIPKDDSDLGFIDFCSKQNKRRFINHDLHINNIDTFSFRDLEEIKDIVLNNRIDDQGFGSIRDFSEILKKLRH